MTWSIQNKMVCVFATVVLIIVLVSLMTYRNAYRLIDANQLVFHSHEVQEKLGEILSLLKDAETGQRGFLLTGDDQYLAPYRTATGSLNGALQQVEQLVEDNSAQTENIKRLRPLVTRKLQELDQTICLRQQSGLAQAQAIVQRGSGKESMDRIRACISDMRSIENDLLRKRIEQVQRENTIATSTIIVATLLNLLLLALGYFAITKYLRERRELESRIDHLNQRLQQQIGESAPAGIEQTGPVPDHGHPWKN